MRNVVHVSPRDDLIEHDTCSFGACVCGPDAQPVRVGFLTDSGVSVRHVGWAIVHHSLDGRELQEV